MRVVCILMQPPKKRNHGRVSNLSLLAFKIDPETLTMLDELRTDVEAAGDAFSGRGRAHTIRKAIRFAHATRPWRL